MKNYIRKLQEELTAFQKKKQQPCSLSLSLDGASLTGINLIFAGLYTHNRGLSGNFSSLSVIKEQEYYIQTKETIPYISYELHPYLFCFRSDLELVLPHIDPNHISYEDVKRIRQELESHRLSALSPTDEIISMKDSFHQELIKIPISHIGFKRKEIIANDYVSELQQQKRIIHTPPSTHESSLDFSSTTELLTNFFSIASLEGYASMNYLKKLSLDSILEDCQTAQQNATALSQRVSRKLNYF